MVFALLTTNTQNGKFLVTVQITIQTQCTSCRNLPRGTHACWHCTGAMKGPTYCWVVVCVRLKPLWCNLLSPHHLNYKRLVLFFEESCFASVITLYIKFSLFLDNLKVSSCASTVRALLLPPHHKTSLIISGGKVETTCREAPFLYLLITNTSSNISINLRQS